MFFEPKAKKKTREFVKYINFLSQTCSNEYIDTFGLTKRQLLQKFITETEEYIKYNEWGVGLEHILVQLYEVEFTIDEKAIQLAKDALHECGFELDKWKIIDELKAK
ncbi:hypothetical protein GXP67_14965 [Rhodocytophaga rosea]|uniref:MafI family immunity protein n=1 Tax=Rhodocytophaga rosea TaxID=2704465 RepID=A0A6C0GIM2_9BACT|nr:hypothetical protein [Rhodocytophaga rosea]QHT67848.1 hypothetical protein GXP67_14965 [Rhodocytophaga rosea]